ncbi:Hypothetical predicted protein [Mytilus galloprovincialis]|uniref:Uncharacterized protein n=1 Tax=Mytilus galloprovincialis TaxID=29158 RepID=A0A8B6E581_MYTGA|nr:Hypothetical predicted protein [Mytilus galloprovincialis]
MSSDWRYSYIECFGNIGLSIRTYLVPCYTFGKNAQLMDKNCLLYGLLCAIPLLNVMLAVNLRRQIRIKYKISGSVPKDILALLLCPFCTLIQESQQLTDHQIETKIPSDMVIERDDVENQTTIETPS